MKIIMIIVMMLIMMIIIMKIMTIYFHSHLRLQVELQRAVQECSETEGGAEEAAGGGGTTQTDGVHQRLFSILTRLLQEGGTSGVGGTSQEWRGQGHTALNF